MKKITKAIIPVAGYGTRMLPITKTVEKCMLPVCNRPVIDYIVEDCVKAGITDIYFVISEGSTQVESYYGRNQKLEAYLLSHGKDDKLPLVIPPENVSFHYVRQNPNGKYGTAIPVALALSEIGTDKPAVVVMGDDFIYRRDGESEIAGLIDKYQAGEGIMLGVPIDEGDTRKFGFLELNKDNELISMTEAVTVDKAPSNLINVSRYIMPPELLKEVKQYAEGDTDEPEYYITTMPFDNFIKQGGVVKVIPATGEYLDGGSLEGWLHANEIIGKDLLKKS